MHAIFLDRDGVICQNRTDHVKGWHEFEFLPGVFDALRTLRALDLPIIVVTNQAVINRGLSSAKIVEQIHARMTQAIRTQGGRIDAVYACPHRPDEDCECRKPKAGLLLQAAKDFKIDLKKSYMVGDATTDIQAGQSAGCKTFLVLTGRGLEELDTCTRTIKQSFEAAFDLQAVANRISDLESYGESFVDRASFFFNVKPSGQAVVYG